MLIMSGGPGPRSAELGVGLIGVGRLDEGPNSVDRRGMFAPLLVAGLLALIPGDDTGGVFVVACSDFPFLMVMVPKKGMTTLTASESSPPPLRNFVSCCKAL